jgi:hypothetical protein
VPAAEAAFSKGREDAAAAANVESVNSKININLKYQNINRLLII